jgi:hypothetical protein
MEYSAAFNNVFEAVNLLFKHSFVPYSSLSSKISGKEGDFNSTYIHWLRPRSRNSPLPPAFGLKYEGAIGQPR